MTNRRIFVLAIFAVLTAMALSTAALGQANENSFANVTSIGSGVRFDVAAANGGMTLTVSAPDGRTFSKNYRAGASPEFAVTDKSLPDGVYTYELRLHPALTQGQRDSLKAARGNDDEPESDRAARKRPLTPNMVQSGSFALLNGQIIVAGMSEENRPAKASVQPSTAQPGNATRVLSGNTVTRLRNHRLSLLSNFVPDQVIADDLIVQGSICAGLDCVNNESFGFDTIRLKENNTRISFVDTSISPFPTNDWTIRANSNASGGANFLAFVDRGANSPGDETGTIVFEVDAGAPANSLKVANTGKVGLRTATPALDLHINTGDTPAIRYEQNSGGGFIAQTWDIGGNEANFFVRDVTGGSRLPFRVRPGAPTSSIDISGSGNVGIGTASPATRLAVSGNASIANTVDSANNLLISGLTKGVRIGSTTTFGAVEGVDNSGLGSYQPLLVNGSDVRIANSAAEAMRITGGNVGIGTQSPTALLSVNGTANKPGGGSWDVFSDERLKTIKGDYKSGLSAVMKLTPIRYEYLKNNALGLKSEGEHIGFGAQSLQKVIPEAVIKNSDGYLMVNNDPIIWTMLNAIKEQQKEIEQLKGQIQKLRATSHRRRR